MAYEKPRAGDHEVLGSFGAAEAIRGRGSFPIHQAAYDTSLGSARNAMGEEDFDAAQAEGAARSTEEARRRTPARDCPTTTSRPGCSFHPALCSPTSPTSTQNSASAHAPNLFRRPPATAENS